MFETKIRGLMSLDEALSGLVPQPEIETRGNRLEDILPQLTIARLPHVDFEGREREGQLVVNTDVVVEVVEIFTLLFAARFPIASMVPLAAFGWSDDASMAANNCVAFDFRYKAGKDELSVHSYGRAVDINPQQNPFIGRGMVLPPGCVYDPSARGAITADGLVVQLFKERGWTWGGDWITIKDYQHFEKP